jgi:hypothetical protein
VSIEATLRHLRSIEAARQEAGRVRAERLRALAPAAARLLRRSGARRVVLFGSLAPGNEPGPSCDLDLAVEGLPRERYFRVLAELQELAAGPVDLVELERAPESLRARIADEGVPL